MITLIRRFLRNVVSIRGALAPSRIRLLSILRLRNVGTRLPAYVSLGACLQILKFYVVSSAILAVFGSLGVLTLTAIVDHLKNMGFLNIWDWSAVGPDTLTAILKWLWSISSIWLLIVTLNHWNLVYTTILTLPDGGSLLAAIPTLGAWLYVVLVDMSTEFFKTLLSNPANLGSTRTILELQLFIGLVFDTGSLVASTLISYIPFNGWLLVGHAWVVAFIQLVGSGLGSFISQAWSALVVGIFDQIRPNVPTILVPVSDPIFRTLSAGIALSMIGLFIRLFFWVF